MEKVYHYTKIKNIEGIIRNDAIHLYSAFFRKYAKEDYLWIKNSSKDVVKEICKEQNWPYDEEVLTLKPYFISFCLDENSSYMWQNYADAGKGIKLIFNKELLKKCNHLNPKGNGDYIPAIEATLPCIYIENKSFLKKQLMDNINIDDLQSWDYFDRLRFLVSAIKQTKPYAEEQEYRHVHLELVESTATYNNGNFYFQNNEGPIEKKDMGIEILFPKEILVGIELGPNTVQEELCRVQNYVKSIGYDYRIVTRRKL